MTGREAPNDLGGWFAQLDQAFAIQAASGIDAVYQLRFRDAAPYHLTVSNGALDHGAGEHATPTVTIYFDSFDSHRAVIQGRLDPMDAFLRGQLRADGHIVLVMRMLQMFVPQYALTGPEQLH